MSYQHKRPAVVARLDKLVIRAQAQLLHEGVTHPERELRLVISREVWQQLRKEMDHLMVQAVGLAESKYRGLPLLVVPGGGDWAEVVRKVLDDAGL